MTIITAWLEIYWREVLFGLFWTMQGLFLILLITTAHRASVVRKKLNRILEKVEACVNSMQKEDKPETQTAAVHIQNRPERDHKVAEEESRIISSVLKEIFP